MSPNIVTPDQVETERIKVPPAKLKGLTGAVIALSNDLKERLGRHALPSLFQPRHSFKTIHHHSQKSKRRRSRQ